MFKTTISSGDIINVSLNSVLRNKQDIGKVQSALSLALNIWYEKLSEREYKAVKNNLRGRGLNKKKPARISTQSNQILIHINEPTPGRYIYLLYVNKNDDEPFGLFSSVVLMPQWQPQRQTNKVPSLVFERCSGSEERRIRLQTIQIPIYSLFLRRLGYHSVMSIVERETTPVIHREDLGQLDLPFSFVDFIGSFGIVSRLEWGTPTYYQYDHDELLSLNSQTGQCVCCIVDIANDNNSNNPGGLFQKKKPISDLLKEKCNQNKIDIPSGASYCLFFDKKIQSIQVFLSGNSTPAIRTSSKNIIYGTTIIGQIIEGIAFFKTVPSIPLTNNKYEFLSFLRSDIRNEIRYSTISEEYAIVVKGVAREKKLVTSQSDSSLAVQQIQSLASISTKQSYITTIGFYDQQYNLLLVAKFPSPIKRKEDSELSFTIEFPQIDL